LAVSRIDSGRSTRLPPRSSTPFGCRSTPISTSALSPQGRARLILRLRALDARQQGNSYRTIAIVLFGLRHISERAWKTHDLRSRTIRLVQGGFALVRGGYRDLLRYGRKEK
jgi:hypothetical protein